LLVGADNQAGFIRALHAHMSEPEYQELINFARNRCGKRGIDRVLEENGVDIIMGPGDGPMMNIASTAGKFESYQNKPLFA
jgi:amidase